MEEQFDFQIDFENMPSLPIAETPVNEASQDDNAYIETEIEGKKGYMCADCGKVFKYPSQVSRHSIIHKKDRPYSCTFQGCNKSFKRADILESHLQLHTANLPFVCDEPGCDRSFASKPALKYHKIRHTNNRIFKCEFEGCGKSFLLASQLKQHEKAVNYHIDDVAPPELAPSERKDPQYYLNRLNPDQSELQRLMSGPSTEAEWKIMTQKCKGLRTEEGLQESFRLFFNYLISENLILKEQARKEKLSKAANQINPGSFIFSSSSHSPISQLSRLSERLDSDELKFLEYLKENSESRV